MFPKYTYKIFKYKSTLAMNWIYEMPCKFLPEKNLHMITDLIRDTFSVLRFSDSQVREYDTAVVAQNDRKYVAVLLLKKMTSEEEDAVQNAAEIHKIECFCVMPAFRRKGLGTEMLETLRNIKNRTYELEIDSVGTNGKEGYELLKNFYEKNGFKVAPAQKNKKYTVMRMHT